ncbi:MAG: ATP-binding protein, partial [Muribaculaceae bacterium]|nr:ATP-binding protein [Muribaculaceae bacterium]
YYTLTHLPEPELITVKAGDYFHNLRLMAEAELQSRGLAINTVQYVVPEDMMLSIDPALMNQVMLNLLRNALDAVASTPNPRVEVVISVSDTHPYLTVSDNGEGIPEKVMDNLFQPFYTTKPGGSGVGLSICRQIVRRHGGELTIRSRVGKGTDAVITL